jgi:hypothetical protein
MPVTTLHPLYIKKIDKWQKCRTVIGGEEEVKAAGTDFLPKLDEQKAEDYEAYKERGCFFNASSRTVKGLLGAIKRKDMDLSFPESKEEILKTVGSAGETFDQIAFNVVEEVIGIGRYGLFVDASIEEDEDPDPFISCYLAEEITSWKNSITPGGDKKLTRVVLRERVDVPRDDQFAFDSEVKYRVLRLGTPSEESMLLAELDPEEVNEAMETGIYFVEIWHKVEDSAIKGEEKWEIERTIIPKKKGGIVFTEIPFVFFNPDNNDPEPDTPPILDLVNVNISHYRNSVDLEWGRHFTALPTPVVTGHDSADKKELKIGGRAAWLLKNHLAKAFFLEFTGSGLGNIQEGMDKKESQMAVLGARLLEEQKRAAETAETTKLRQTGEQSILASISEACSEGLTKIVKIVCEWVGIQETEEVSVKLNKDFNITGMDAKMLSELMKSLQAGGISWDTWFYNLKRGELIPDNVESEDVWALVKEGLPESDAEPPEGAATTKATNEVN